jgi:predicted phosphatase
MIHLFDLDLTVWDCFNKKNDPIWAKQMVFPFNNTSDVIVDDVGSICMLREGVREYLKYLEDNNHKIGFVSAGKHPTIPYEHQQSVHLLRKFGIYKHFNYIKRLESKIYDKTLDVRFLVEKIVFYDDNDEVLNKMKQFKHVTAVDSKELDWNDLIGKTYD